MPSVADPVGNANRCSLAFGSVSRSRPRIETRAGRRRDRAAEGAGPSWRQSLGVVRRATKSSSCAMEKRTLRPIRMGTSSSLQMSWYSVVRLMASILAA